MIRGVCFYVQGVDFLFHHFSQRAIYHTVSRHCVFPGELAGYDMQPVMAAAGLRAGVPRMQVAFILEFEHGRLQGGQSLADAVEAVHAGKVLRNGLTLTVAYTPAAT